MKHLLLLHGAIGAKDQLQPLADLLKNDFVVHVFNFSGHGGKPFAEEPFSIQAFASELEEYVIMQKIQQASVFGYSMGGYVALYLAKQQPQFFSAIITLATKFQWDEAVAAKESAMLNTEIILEKVPVFAEQLKQRHAPNDWKLVLNKTKEMLLQMGKENPLQLSDYTAINQPVLLLLGDNDKMVTRQETEAVQKALPNSSFQLLEQTAHPIEKANSTVLADIIRGFCKS
ncbi:alpha/beta fold hydrolase [Lacibacter sediminis]|uniref:Alpha/beta fold hydrolase n=1 Tax=Lacibacter sediminis TaxID=2760713 RepID=A0A7G5XCB0_9BACT|nr:alpha/beta fold hydrolase [Lacibacter sediminis]QNA43113.1 alpha/beta fold hydrolase [Lacibacter sediminis]